MKSALTDLWPLTGELFVSSNYETELLKENISVNLQSIKASWNSKVAEVLHEGTLSVPSDKTEKGEMVWMQTGGKDGKHTEHLGYLLAEMQFLQRAYPGGQW